MCTLSVLRRPEPVIGSDDDPLLWRVGFNRDERRTRPPALPPSQHIYDGRAALHPTDPLGGGTWIAASSAGLVFALLNGYSESDRTRDPRVADPRADDSRIAATKSRGLIIPALLTAADLDDATRRLKEIDATAFLSFRLVIITDNGALEAVGDGRQLALQDVHEGGAWMRSSSGRSPEVVLPHRRAIFQHDVDVPSSRSATVQDGFHLTRDARDPGLGVLMERDDARTVSLTTVEVFATRMQMTYRPIEPDAAPVTVDLARQAR